MDSSSYLMMLYVTLEQESALRDFFGEQGWMFCKPDLSVTTDKLGPSIPCKQDPDEETIFPETNMFPVVKPSFPTIKINSILSNMERKKTFIPRKGKRKATSLLKKPVIPVKQTRGAKDKTVATVEESNENKGTESTKAIEAEDDSQFEIKIERDNDENESPDTGSLNEDTDGDGDDDFRDKDDMEYDNEVETAESVENASGKGESVESADGSVVDDTVASESTTNKMESSKKPFECKICGKTYSKSHMSRHMKLHDSNAELHHCRVCGKGFYEKYSMKRHEMALHQCAKPHKCDLCDESFSYTYQVKLHQSKVHNIGNKYECLRCGKSFPIHCNFQAHVKICSDQPQERITCAFCERTFKSSDSLRGHIRNIHLNTQAYVCDLCGKTFSRKSILERHLKAKKHTLDLETT
ncbi:zinc finger and BTB domain-containing protein 14-like [Ruditapes philippinarum]|uniref:zinc finger and BTB domain-containing protein 14-like n=1 Tax=Ruditapes philippinarum TaxID=129788 RepID=UPI00295A7E37|nr:zinc finger and BTB domain-containing protein 14-like [Ruditapes philippinarum]